jgi:hypothetical protein
MEAGFIEFDPTSEFFILETLDYDEEVLRPESLRFFTLDEQLTDYFDKVLPKKAMLRLNRRIFRNFIVPNAAHKPKL